MALKGYISPNTYTNIDNTIYEKSTKRCTVSLSVYRDNADGFCLSNTSITVEGYRLVPSLISLNPVKSVPENITEGTMFLIGQDAEGSLKGLEGRIARIGVSGSIESFYLQDAIFVLYVEDEQKYYKYINKEWIEEKNILADKRIWDKWFAPEVALAEGTNPTKQMYKFMKTLEQFKDCVDA